MTTSHITRLLDSARTYDMVFDTPASTSNGWKLSIQGKSINDAAFLYSRLHTFLFSNDIPFKVGTARRFSIDGEQGYKAMTIYCPNNLDLFTLAEDVYSIIIDYKGWQDIKTPSAYSHYAGGVFFRSDRDASGAYVPAKKAA